MAIHNLLADVVEVCGGSRQLLKILNRIGCVSSSYTHDHFVTLQAELQRNKSIWEELSDKIFTIASTDNFDMLQSYASVYCGDHQRSYHGTTVQVVQPHQSMSFTVPANTNVYKVDAVIDLPHLPQTHLQFIQNPKNIEQLQSEIYFLPMKNHQFQHVYH